MSRTVTGLIFSAGFSCITLMMAHAQQEPPEILAIEATVPLAASTMAYGYGALWTMSDGKMFKIAGMNNDVVEIAVPGSENAQLLMELDRYRGIAVGEGAVWLTDMASSTIFKIDPEKNMVVMAFATDVFGGSGSIGVGEGSVWVVTFDSHDKTLTRYNSQSGAIEARIALPRASKGVVAAFGSVWVTAASRGELYRIDPGTNQVAATIPLHGATHLVAADETGSIWLAYDSEGIVQRVDGRSGEILATIGTGATDMESDGDIAAGGGFIWMINRGSIVSRIDARTNSSLGTFRPPSGSSNGRRLRYGGNSLWLSGNAIYRVAPPP